MYSTYSTCAIRFWLTVQYTQYETWTTQDIQQSLRSLSKQIDTLWNFVDEIKIPGLDDGVNLQDVEESTESETQEDAEEEDVEVEEKEDDGEDGEGRCNKKRRLDHP